MTGIWGSSCATPSGGLLFGHLAEPTPLTGYKPKTCIDVNNEHTPLNYTSRRNSFNIENNDLTTTTAASDNSDGFHQQAAASGGPQRAPASVVNPWLGADTWSSTRKLVRGNESLSSVEGTLSRGKKEIKIWKVCKLERKNVHVYLEQKAGSAVQGECAAQKNIWGWSTNWTKRNWEQRCSDIALYETDRELASQRLELCQASQWADQAQREKINLCGGLEMRNRRFQESFSTWRTTWRTLSQPPRILTIFFNDS